MGEVSLEATNQKEPTTMKPPTPEFMLYILEKFDWSGHVELGRNDLEWLAASLSAALHGNKSICSACNCLHEIIIETALGPICEDCIEEMSDQASETREVLEAKEDLDI
jgi:hypothetical protein